MFSPAEQGRPVRARISKDAFAHNLRLAQQLAYPAQALAVLKADAYGHGLIEMAQVVSDLDSSNPCDIGVASSDEAQRLYQAGIRSRVWVLEGPFTETCLRLNQVQDLVWVIHSHWQLDLLSALPEQGFKIWLKLDSGMHRLGFALDQVPVLQKWLDQHPKIQCLGWMTHFACSDDAQSSHTTKQLAAFEQALEALPESLSNRLSSASQNQSFQHNSARPALCVANSAALLQFPLSHKDWVRPGIMLYGGLTACESGGDSVSQKAVMQLTSAVMALRTIPAGEGVGYGFRWRAPRESRIATVAIGYGDGYPRHAPDGTPVWINSQRAPLVGRVSMDMITIDVTDLGQVDIGDEVELWGPSLSVEEVAHHCRTISYELLTRVTARVPKIYS